MLAPAINDTWPARIKSAAQEFIAPGVRPNFSARSTKRPTSKLQRSSNIQAPNIARRIFEVWSLVILWSLVLGRLVLFIVGRLVLFTL
jgi:hypothetical protein